MNYRQIKPVKVGLKKSKSKILFHKDKEVNNEHNDHNEDNEHNEECDNETSLKLKCAELKVQADKIHKANKNKIKQIAKKDKELDNLIKEIDELYINNAKLEFLLNSELQDRNRYDYEQRKFADELSDLKDKFLSTRETDTKYKNQIEILRKEKEQLEDDYKNKLNIIIKKSEGLEKEIDYKQKTILKIQSAIEINKRKISVLNDEIYEQNQLYLQTTAQNDKKMSLLHLEFHELQKKSNELQQKYELRKNQNIKSRIETIEDEENKIDQQLREYDMKNQQLLQEINELNKQLMEFSIGSSPTIDITNNRLNKNNSVRTISIPTNFK